MGAKAFCLAGSMMTADGGFWMAGGQAAGLAHHWPTTGNTTPTPTAPHKCPTWGIDQPNRTMHPHLRSLALNMVPKGDPRDRGFRTVFTHRKQASASDHSFSANCPPEASILRCVPHHGRRLNERNGFTADHPNRTTAPQTHPPYPSRNSHTRISVVQQY